MEQVLQEAQSALNLLLIQWEREGGGGGGGGQQ